MGSFSGDKSGHFSIVSLFRAAADAESREVLGLAPVCCFRSARAARAARRPDITKSSRERRVHSGRGGILIRTVFQLEERNA